MLGLIELAQVISALVSGDVPDIVVKTGHPTGVVYIADLGLVVPLMLLAGAWIRARRPWGYVAAAMLLVTGIRSRRPADQYLRSFRIEGRPGWPEVTFRHLLTHTAGIGGVLRPEVPAGGSWSGTTHRPRPAHQRANLAAPVRRGRGECGGMVVPVTLRQGAGRWEMCVGHPLLAVLRARPRWRNSRVRLQALTAAAAAGTALGWVRRDQAPRPVRRPQHGLPEEGRSHRVHGKVHPSHHGGDGHVGTRSAAPSIRSTGGWPHPHHHQAEPRTFTTRACSLIAPSRTASAARAAGRPRLGKSLSAPRSPRSLPGRGAWQPERRQAPLAAPATHGRSRRCGHEARACRPRGRDADAR